MPSFSIQRFHSGSCSAVSVWMCVGSSDQVVWAFLSNPVQLQIWLSFVLFWILVVLVCFVSFGFNFFLLVLFEVSAPSPTMCIKCWPWSLSVCALHASLGLILWLYYLPVAAQTILEQSYLHKVVQCPDVRQTRTRTHRTSAVPAVRQAICRAVHQGPLRLGRPPRAVHQWPSA
jgi:hypothetical protein